MEEKRKNYFRGGTVVLLFLAVLYGVGIWYYRDHFLPGTVADGMDLSQMSLEEVEARLDHYTLTLEERTADGSMVEEVLNGRQLGLGWGRVISYLWGYVHTGDLSSQDCHPPALLNVWWKGGGPRCVSELQH